MRVAKVRVKPKHPAGTPMTLGNMRDLGVQRLIASCRARPPALSRVLYAVARAIASLHSI